MTCVPSRCEQEEELKDAILLVFANKQDSKGALNAQQVTVFVCHAIPLHNSSLPRLTLTPRSRTHSGCRTSKTGNGPYKKRRRYGGRACSKALIGA